MYSDSDDLLMQAGFPHSDIPGSKLDCQLPEAYRRLLRPSSPVAAKASTICAYSLDHITPSGLKSYVYFFTNASSQHGSLTDPFQRLKLQLSKLLKSRKKGDEKHFPFFCCMFAWWWSQAGSNRRPPACKAGALPAELWPRLIGGSGKS